MWPGYNNWHNTCNTSSLEVPLFPDGHSIVYLSHKGELLFSSIDLVEVIIPNLKCGPWLCYWNKMLHILAQKRFEGVFWLLCVRFTEKYFFTFLHLQDKKLKKTGNVYPDFVIGVKCITFRIHRCLRFYFWRSTLK